MVDAYCIPGQVANFFLSKKNHDIDNLKLNKLLFISLGFGLALLWDKELFREDVQAWAYGPIVPSIYHEFKHFKRNKITSFSKITLVKRSGFIQVSPTIDDDEEMNRVEKELIIRMLEKIWEVYGGKTPLELVDITHTMGAPWSQIYSPRRTHIIIPRNVIREYYNGLLL